MLRNLLGLRLFLTLLGIGGAVIFAVVAGYRSELVLGTLIAGVALLFTAAQQTLSVPLSGSLRLGLVSAWTSPVRPPSSRSSSRSSQWAPVSFRSSPRRFRSRCSSSP